MIIHRKLNNCQAGIFRKIRNLKKQKRDSTLSLPRQYTEMVYSVLNTKKILFWMYTTTSITESIK